MAHQPPGQFQFEERQLHCGGTCAGLADEFVDAKRRGGEQVGDVSRGLLHRASSLVRVHVLTPALAHFADVGSRRPVEGAEQFAHVLDRLHQHRAVADQQCYSYTSL